MAPAAPLLTQQGHNFPSVTAQGHAHVHLGDIYNLGPEPDGIKAQGLCFGFAPLIDHRSFVGRHSDLDAMMQILRPYQASVEQQRLVLGGMGGIGKTQLAIAYARRQQHNYDSVFWLNATSKSTLHVGFRSIARTALEARNVEQLDDEQILARVHVWLSNARSGRWLLIFDNYDDPDQFDIQEFYPNSGRGSVIVTTRLPDMVNGQQLRVRPLSTIDDSLNILQTRSCRHNIKDDPDARLLAERLKGLPLALATAGALLRKSTLSFQRYLQEYDRKWNLDPRRPLQLQEYQDRTLYNTWNLSYTKLTSEDPEAAQLLSLLAYFDNQDIWYELLRAGVTKVSPLWLQNLLTDQMSFESVMRTLVDYCLVEVQDKTRSYSIHSCVHDWALAELNKTVDPQFYWYAFQCVAATIGDTDSRHLEQLSYARITRHAARLVHHRFNDDSLFDDLMPDYIVQAISIAVLLGHQVQFVAAEQIYLRTLAESEKVPASSRPVPALEIGRNLGNLYRKQGKLEKAEQLLMRALAECEAVLGPENIWTLWRLHDLGTTYCDQGRFMEAEHMYQRALTGVAKAPKRYTSLPTSTRNELGILYRLQGRMAESKQMLLSALSGYEKQLGSQHTLTLNVVNNLGDLYCAEKRLDEAEEMYVRALVGKENLLGADHTSTLYTSHHLGNVYCRQGKLQKGEQALLQALIGYEKALGLDHDSTLWVVQDLGYLYAHMKEWQLADEMYLRAISGFQTALDSSKSPRRSAISCLAMNLSRGTKINKIDVSVVRLHTMRLIELVKKWSRLEPAIVVWLAQALVGIGDYENAQVAFQHIARNTENGPSEFGGTECDSCNRRVTVSMGLHVCAECVECDLCDSCFSHYHEGCVASLGCCSHKFFHVDKARILELGSRGDDFDAWIERLLNQYATSRR